MKISIWTPPPPPHAWKKLDPPPPPRLENVGSPLEPWQIIILKKKTSDPLWERSGRVLDSIHRDREFQPHRRHCVLVLEQDTFILA